MDKSIFAVRRKNYIASGEIFFWTATINKSQRLLKKDDFKNVMFELKAIKSPPYKLIRIIHFTLNLIWV